MSYRRGTGQYSTDTGTGVNTGGIAVSPIPAVSEDVLMNQLPLPDSNPLMSFAQPVCAGAGCTPSGTSSGTAAAPQISSAVLTAMILGAVVLVGMFIAKGAR